MPLIPFTSLCTEDINQFLPEKIRDEKKIAGRKERKERKSWRGAKKRK
jgi:hypothetical protein